MGIKELFTGKDPITQELDNARKYLQPRRDRIKEDIEKRYLLEKYVFKDLDGREHKGINNVTLNDSRLYADAMIRILGTAKRRFEFIHKDKKLADDAEKFVEWCLTKADELLIYQNLMAIEPSANFTSCVEGAIADRVILYHDTKTDKWLPEIMPLDPYSIIYVNGKKGLRIGSIESTRPADEILAQYGKSIKGREGKVEDIWTIDQNIVKVDGQVADGYPLTHPLNMNAIIFVLCPTIPYLTSQTDAVKYVGESIYAGVRDMYDTQNREATGWSTQNWMGFLPPVVGIMKPGRKLPKMQYGIGAQISLEDGERVDSWPIKDLSPAHQIFFGQLSSRIQQATFSNIQHGQLSFELSAVAIKELSAKSDQHFIPRLIAKRNRMIQIAYNLMEQFASGGYPTDLEGLGEKITEWKPKDFKDKGIIVHCDYFAETPEENIADMTIANTAMALGLPPEVVYEKQLHMENIPEIMQKRAREMAIKLSPVAAQYYCGEMLKDSPDEIDKKIAELLKMEAGNTGGAATNPPSQPSPQTTLPLLPKGSPVREQARRQGISEEDETPPPRR